MIVLDNLKSLGYDVEIKENNIRLSYKGEGRPDKNRVLPLLEELKANKNEAIKELQKGEELKPISEEILDDLLFATIRRTKKDYSKAVIDYARDNHKDVSEGITKISAEVSRIYKLCKEGKATLDDFKGILEPYHGLCSKAIRLYKEEILRVSSNV